MLIKEKINLKKYILFSLPLVIAIIYLAKNKMEVVAMLTVFVAACLNHWMLLRSVKKITDTALTGNEVDQSGFFWPFLGKAIVLIVALVFSVQIMGKRIIIPVLIYVLQIVILYLSLKTQAEKGLE